MIIFKKIIGVLSLILGFIALITPFTPGAFWLIFLGFELLGIHFIFGEKIKIFLIDLGRKIIPKRKKPINNLAEINKESDLNK